MDLTDLISNGYDILSKYAIVKINNELYTQKQGVIMGDSAAPMISNLVILIHIVEHQIQSDCKIKLCLRCIDDTLFICKFMNVNKVIALFKKYHPSFLEITYDEMKQNKIKFLDFMILKIQNNIEYIFQIKSIKLEFYVPYNSQHPQHMKINILRNMFKRAAILCSNEILYNIAKIALIIRFQKSGYPYKFIQNNIDDNIYRDRYNVLNKIKLKYQNKCQQILDMKYIYYKPIYIPLRNKNCVQIPYDPRINYQQLKTNINKIYPRNRIVYKLNDSIQKIIRCKDANYDL